MFRPYQAECSQLVHQHLQQAHQCLVKMFCGTGKSRVMRRMEVVTSLDEGLVLYVMPSLALCQQFFRDYLRDVPATSVLRVSSDSDKSDLVSTTDPAEIERFLQGSKNKLGFVTVTYQSYGTLMEVVERLGSTFDIICFDEAHFSMYSYCHDHIFRPDWPLVHAKKRVFFTATPHEEMTDGSKCGKVITAYSYAQALSDGWLSGLRIIANYYTAPEDTLATRVEKVMEAIARNYFATGNGRVLSMHRLVNGTDESAVWQFVAQRDQFEGVVRRVWAQEFASAVPFPKRIRVEGLAGTTPASDREKVFERFNATPDDELVVLASCQVIREGIDLPNANAVVFVDPKSSINEIIQNIGRVVRKGRKNRPASVVVCCWVDPHKYGACQTDEERDEALRGDLHKGGNFNIIANILMGLKLDDEDLFRYPNFFPKRQMKAVIASQGFEVQDDPVHNFPDNDPAKLLAYLEKETKHKVKKKTDRAALLQKPVPELLEAFAKQAKVCVEVLTDEVPPPGTTNLLQGEDEEEGIKMVFNEVGADKQVVRFARFTNVHYDEELEEEGEEEELDDDAGSDFDSEDSLEEESVTPTNKGPCRTTYCPIVDREENSSANAIRTVHGPKRGSRTVVHHCADNDVKLLLKIAADGDFGDSVRACVVEGELQGEKKSPMQQAEEIVERAKAREEKGGKLLPRKFCRDREKRENGGYLKEEMQEHRDAEKLGDWKKEETRNCPEEVREYLDSNLRGWRDDLAARAMETALEIVERAKIREGTGRHSLPRRCCENQNVIHTDEEWQEHRDALKLNNWKQGLAGKGRSNCPDVVREYLDVKLPGWRDSVDLEAKSMESAREIVKRAEARVKIGGKLFPRQCCKDRSIKYSEEEKQEHIDAAKLRYWKQCLAGNGKSKCPEEARKYLDLHMPGWSDDLETKSIEAAREIVERANQRLKNGGRLLPRHCCNNRSIEYTEEQWQEHRDAEKLQNWKQGLAGTGKSNCPWEYLDVKLPGWRDSVDLAENAIQRAREIVERATERVKNGGKLLPRCCCRDRSIKYTEEQWQERSDALKLRCWKQSLAGNGSWNCPEEVREYLDAKLPGWRDSVDLADNAMQRAREIVERAKAREEQGGQLLPRQCCCNKEKREKGGYTAEELQEHRDATKLAHWKNALSGKQRLICPKQVKDYLDTNLPGWRDGLLNTLLKKAKDVVARADRRKKEGLDSLPSSTHSDKQQQKDAEMLDFWKKALREENDGICPDKLRDYLDNHLPGWQTVEVKPTPSNSEEEDEDNSEEESRPTKRVKATTTLCRQKRKPSAAEPEETSDQKRARTKSALQEFHNRYLKMTANNLAQEFRQHPQKFQEYHAVRQECMTLYQPEEQPHQWIIQQLTDYFPDDHTKQKQVVDLGCGLAPVAAHFRNTGATHLEFHNYDHVAVPEWHVDACNMAHTPQNANLSVHACIFCLALSWGTDADREQYLANAYRMLDCPGGMLFVLDSTKHWSDTDQAGVIQPGMEGKKLRRLLQQHGFTILEEDCTTKFCKFVCQKLRARS